MNRTTMKLATRNNEVRIQKGNISPHFINLLLAGTQQGKENSRMYNEMVVLKLVQSMTKLIMSPPEVFKDQIHEHFRKSGEKFYKRIKSWMELSEVDSSQKENVTSEGELHSENSKKRLIE